jgi:DNA-binding response OmpR family regulator
MLKAPHIVVADEDPQLLELLVRTLRDAGYCVFQAYDGRAAYDLASLSEPLIS